MSTTTTNRLPKSVNRTAGIFNRIGKDPTKLSPHKQAAFLPAPAWPVIETHLDALDQTLQRLFHATNPILKLELNPSDSHETKLGKAAAFAAEADEHLVSTGDSLRHIYEVPLASNITFTGSYTQQYFNQYRDEAIEQCIAQLLEELDYQHVLRPWFSNALVQRLSIEEIYAAASEHYAEKLRADVIAPFLRAWLTGVEKGIYGTLQVGPKRTGGKPVGLKYGWVSHEINDERHTRETIDTIVQHTDRQTTRCIHLHDLILPRFYDLEATLQNPRVSLPRRYRVLLENMPELFHGSLFSVFGTQVGAEVQIRRVIGTEELNRTEFRRHLDWEPAIVFAGGIVLAGWGQEDLDRQKKYYHRQKEILDDARSHLDHAAEQRGRFAHAITHSSVLLLLSALASLVAYETLPLAIFFIAPFALYAGATLVRTLYSTWETILTADYRAKCTVDDGYRELCGEYSDFDPAFPPLEYADDAEGEGS